MLNLKDHPVKQEAGIKTTKIFYVKAPALKFSSHGIVSTTFYSYFEVSLKEHNIKLRFLTQPNANGRLFPVPNGTVAIGGGWDNLRSQTTPSSQPAVPSPPAT